MQGMHIARSQEDTSVWHAAFLQTLAALIVTGVGSALLALAAHPSWTYFVGGAAVYFGSLVLEGAGMSLLSKVIHPRLAHGLFNMGAPPLLTMGSITLTSHTQWLQTCICDAAACRSNRGYISFPIYGWSV